jgi:uncharacterized membrane protein
MSTAGADGARFENLGARVLQAGLTASAALLVVGLTLWAAGPGVWSRRLLETGLLVLMATPAVRVLVSLVEYWRERDWLFVAAAIAIALVLMASVLSSL